MLTNTAVCFVTKIQSCSMLDVTMEPFKATNHFKHKHFKPSDLDSLLSNSNFLDLCIYTPI